MAFIKQTLYWFFGVEKYVLVPRFKMWCDHCHQFYSKHLFFIASVHYDTVVAYGKQTVLCLFDIVRKPSLSSWVNIKALWASEAWWDICLLSPVFTASVSIKLSMSRSCYCLWRFFFHCPVLEPRFQPVFIKPHCKPIPGVIIYSIIVSQQ